MFVYFFLTKNNNGTKIALFLNSVEKLSILSYGKLC